MRININFVEMNQYIDNMKDPNLSEVMTNLIQDYYFNGADSAVVYIGYNANKEQFEFDLMPG